MTTKKADTITYAQEQGPRAYQEDRSFKKQFKSSRLNGWILAVMDGHGGSRVAELCAKQIGKLFMPQDAANTEKALRHLVVALNSMTEQSQVGSTLSIACIPSNHKNVSIAVLGDSPVIVLDRKGQLHMSPEHNVRSNIEERRVAEKRGGVYEGGYLFTRNGDRGLQMSRALGDAYLENVISHEPDIYTIANPKWILVASDGLFDPGHSQSYALLREIESYAKNQATANDLMQWALSRGLQDNATALVWRLR